MLFSDAELGLLEIEETTDAYTIKLKVYLGRKIFKSISDVIRLRRILLQRREAEQIQNTEGKRQHVTKRNNFTLSLDKDV